MCPEIIPKFINLLQRDRSLIVHGDGQHSRRYLYAGDAADAFDTILHKGSIGQVYNVDSQDEITNIELAKKLLSTFGKDISDRLDDLIDFTKDRPFNDRRYAVDGSKLRALGWEPKTSFEDGLRATVEWYRDYGAWWGDIEHVLTPFPVVHGSTDTNESADTRAGGKLAAFGVKSKDFAVQNGHLVRKKEELPDPGHVGQVEQEAVLGANGTSEKAHTNGFESLKTDSMYKVIKKRKVEHMG